MTISFARHQFPPAIIRHAVWLYVRFTLSYRDVEDLLAERGLDVSYETVRRRVLKFGPLFARELRRRRPRPTSTWHLDEMAVMIAGTQSWLWRVQRRRKGCSREIDAQTAQETGLRARSASDGQALSHCRAKATRGLRHGFLSRREGLAPRGHRRGA
jgi:hypothetical protein